MDAIGEGRTFRVASRAILGLTVTWLALSAATVEASPMRRATSAGLAAQEFAASGSANSLAARWTTFLAGGQATWASRQSPPFTLPVRQALLALVQGDPQVAAASPLVEYFVWRRNLNPTRFDRYHPFLGPQLPQGFDPPTPLVPPVVPDIPTEPPIIPPVPFVPPNVPEPPAILVIALGAIGALILRRRAMPTPQ